jgi:hypothetical protein
MTEEKWETYTKFCFIRNPYDRAYSGWKHVNTIFNRNMPFYDYISQNKYGVSDIEYGHVFMSQKRYIQNANGDCAVNLIGRFEHLESDFKKILNQIGFDILIHREKKVNVSNKEGSKTISIDIKSIRRLNELLEEDLDTLHYKKLLL